MYNASNQFCLLSHLRKMAEFLTKLYLLRSGFSTMAGTDTFDHGLCLMLMLSHCTPKQMNISLPFLLD